MRKPLKNRFKKIVRRRGMNRRFGWLQGTYRSKKCKKPVKYKSSYELAVARYLDGKESVVAFAYEPFSIPYMVRNKGKLEKHKYFPDFYVLFDDEHKELWEVKPSSQRNLAINIAKWKTAAAFCKKAGIIFKIITEKEIKNFN